MLLIKTKLSLQPKRPLRALLIGSAGLALAISSSLSAHGATFMDHWSAPSEARVKQLLADRMSGDLYNVEQGGRIDLALYYAVRGQVPLAQNLNDLPKLQPYLDAPLGEPLKADIYVALTREAVRSDDFDALNSMRQSYESEFQSNLRNYTLAYAQTFVFEDLGLHQAASDSIEALLDNSEFHSLAHFARDQPDTIRRLSEMALAKGDIARAVSRAQDASLSYQRYTATITADPVVTRGMKAKIELTLAEALSASGQFDAAQRYAQSAQRLAKVGGDKARLSHAALVQAEITLGKDGAAAEKQFEVLIDGAEFDQNGMLIVRTFDGLARAGEAHNGSASLKSAEYASQLTANFESRLAARQEAYFEAKKRAANHLNQPVKTVATLAAPKPVADIRSEKMKNMGVLSNPQNLTWLGFGLAILGLLLAFISQLRVSRVRRALEVYSQNLEQSEKVARDNARRAEESMRAAQTADAAKTAFLANMSHEIRTPMNGVLGMADVLRRTTDLDQRQSEIVDAIHTSGASLMTLLGDILDFSKIESGVLELNIVEANLREAVESVATLMSAQARDKGLEILVRYAPDIPENFNVDIGRVRQVLLNLVGNAVKFTKKGHVLINVELSPDEGVSLVKINVLDTGIGIASENQEKIFDDFVQADNARSRKHGGTGLGLSISKKLVEAMDGTISLQSLVGQGSVFSIELPLTLSKTQEGKVAQQFASDRVLIIDNYSASLKILSAQVKAWGLSSTVARKSADGITGLLHAADSGEPFKAVIIDQRCASQSKSFIEDIKSYPSIAKTPVILLTHVAGYDALSETGYTKQVGKPIVGQKLFVALESVFTKASDVSLADVPPLRGLPIAVSPVPERKIKRILLAEANPATRHVIAAFLKDKSIELNCVKDGEQALESAKTVDFDLILMDVQLRKLDGFLATRAIRGHETQTKAIRTPIICLSPFALGADQDLARAVGMDDFLVKPFSPTQLENMMLKWGGIKSDIRALKASKTKMSKALKDPMVQPLKAKKHSAAA